MSIHLQIAIARAKLVARRDFRRAVAILVAAKVAIDHAIAAVARFYAAVALVGPQEIAA